MTTPPAAEPTRRGVFLVTTQTGSRYRIDLHRKTAIRFPASDTHLGERLLRRDEDEVQLIDIAPIQVGEGIQMVLSTRDDGVPTYRLTSDVTLIEEVA